MRQLIVRFLNVAVIAAVLIGYNTVLDKRDKEDQIARLSAELETTQLQKENLQAAAAASNTADTAASEAAEAEGQYVDGTYDGEADGFGGTIAVEVTVEGGQITDLAITSADGEDSAYLSNAEAIIPKIIEAQSVDVDTISGATFSSTGIKTSECTGKSTEETPEYNGIQTQDNQYRHKRGQTDFFSCTQLCENIFDACKSGCIS